MSSESDLQISLLDVKRDALGGFIVPRPKPLTPAEGAQVMLHDADDLDG
jgi:hypothetical protein